MVIVVIVDQPDYITYHLDEYLIYSEESRTLSRSQKGAKKSNDKIIHKSRRDMEERLHENKKKK